MAPSRTQPPKPASRWVILVARGEEDLYEHLRRAFESDSQVELVMDRRMDTQRSPAWVIERLRTHGVAVIRRRP